LRIGRPRTTRIEVAVAAALLAIEDRAAAQAEAEQQERNLAAALQRLGLESVTIRDTMTMTGLSEKYVTWLLRVQIDATTDDDTDDDTSTGTDDGTSTGTDDGTSTGTDEVGGRVDVRVGADRAAG
jgi:hypothetical protein